MCKEYNLTSINVIDEDLFWVKEVGEKLRNEAMEVLGKRDERLNQAQVVTGLQAFYNLEEVKVTVEHFVNKYKNKGMKSVNGVLEMKAISGGDGYGGGIRGSGTAYWRWTEGCRRIVAENVDLLDQLLLRLSVDLQ